MLQASVRLKIGTTSKALRAPVRLLCRIEEGQDQHQAVLLACIFGILDWREGSSAFTAERAGCQVSYLPVLAFFTVPHVSFRLFHVPLMVLPDTMRPVRRKLGSSFNSKL